jgi:hypothetical protein
MWFRKVVAAEAAVQEKVVVANRVVGRPVVAKAVIEVSVDRIEK